MKVKELKKVAEKMYIPQNCYCLSGGLPNECYTLGRNGKKWEVYYSERGSKNMLGVFDNEHEACELLYRYLKEIENTVWSNESELTDQKPHKIPKEWWISDISMPSRSSVEVSFGDRTIRIAFDPDLGGCLLADPYTMFWVSEEDRGKIFAEKEDMKNVLSEADMTAAMDAINDYYRFREDWPIIFLTKEFEGYAYELDDRIKKKELSKAQAKQLLKEAFPNHPDFFYDLELQLAEDRYRWYMILVKPYRPELKDLWFRKEMLADEDTMTYNQAWGGTVDFPEEDWQDWYDYWLASDEGKRYYRYVLNEDDEFIGEIAYHYSDEEDKYLADVIIMDKYRGNGYGTDALKLLCMEAKKNGVKVLYDNIGIHNPAVWLFRMQGFEEEFRTDEEIYLRKEL